MGSRSPRDDGRREVARAAGVAAALIAASLFCLFIALVLQSTSTSGGGGDGGVVREECGRAAYSAAVTVLSGLHPSNDLLHIGTLFPVFNLTVHVEVPPGGKAGGVCLGGHSVAAVVSYGGAFLGEGSVGRVCVEPQQQEGDVAATAWGRDVWMPWVLRRRLAEEMKRGEAELEVAVPMRGGDVLVCKAKIGGDLSPCTLEEASN
uniref:Late embryogenesis abundant protein LEA-2 subgroup domain-containing protein n=1 Tax=Oryza nivara TaxID=4536 RepID=A0A0E0H300_ORYNI